MSDSLTAADTTAGVTDPTAKGSFVWYELMTTDMDAAEAFYRDVVGWNTADSGIPGMRYTMLSAGEQQVAGLMTLPDDAAGAQPGWIGYVGVNDVDAAAKRVAERGGAVHRQPDDIPGVGRFAMAADPQGAMFVLFKPLAGGSPSDSVSPMTAGHISWHELRTTDWEAAFGFYADQFGWAKSEAMDMGPMGLYQMFNAGAGSPGSGDAIGGMMNSPDVPGPVWLYYFSVEDIDAAAKRTTDGGGRILRGPTEIPGGDFVIQAQDPQGAMFALVGKRR